MTEACCLLGLGRRQVLVDAADLSLVAERWHLFVANRTSSGDYIYAARREDGKTILLHRQLMRAPQGTCVDHLNGDRLDNRRSNLRVCSHGENMQNRKLNVDNTSGYKGVSWSKANNGWRAACARKYLGTFKLKEDAIRAYEVAARLRFSHLAGAP